MASGNRQVYIDKSAQERMDALARTEAIRDPTASFLGQVLFPASRPAQIAFGIAKQLENIKSLQKAIEEGNMGKMDAASLLFNTLIGTPAMIGFSTPPATKLPDILAKRFLRR